MRRLLLQALVVVLWAVAVAIALRYTLNARGGLGDFGTYWTAAQRLGAGENPYLPIEGTGLSYRYAPWFAGFLVPLTWFPIEVVQAVWRCLSAVALAWLLWPLLRGRSLAGALLSTFMLATLSRTVIGGNVQLLMLAALGWGLHRRSGPLWIALAASLKIFPVILALLYVRTREWKRLALTLGLTALLWSPALLFDLGTYPIDPATWLPPYPVMLTLAAAAALVAVRPGPYADLALVIAELFAQPRWNHYGIGWLLVPLRSGQHPQLTNDQGRT